MPRLKEGDKVLFVDFDGTITTGIVSSFLGTKPQCIYYNDTYPPVGETGHCSRLICLLIYASIEEI